MTTSITTDWPDVVDVLVTEGSAGLFVFYVTSPDEHAVYTGDLDARTQRAALIEITSWLAQHGYLPTHRWDSDGDADAMRRFRAMSDA